MYNKAVKNPRCVLRRMIAMGFFKSLPDKPYLELIYYAHFGKKLDLKNPKTFNEKLQWLKLYDRNPEYTRMVDKYEAKQYVAEKIGEEYIIPTLGVWDDPDQIDFDALPEQFVLKCTHDSGGLVICRDKSKLNIEEAKEKLKKRLKFRYFYWGREWPYKNIKPRIIAEKYMEDESGTELKDYKVMCFEGEPKLIQVHQGRFGEHTQDFYDTQWQKLEITQGFPYSETTMGKPEFLEEMLTLSKELSQNLHQVRVDWYYVGHQLYFGELTFFDGAGFDGFEPDEYDEIIGNWIRIHE